jgi:hypothetical protein
MLLREHGGNAIHVHEVDLVMHTRDIPLSSLRPDPWLGDERLGLPFIRDGAACARLSLRGSLRSATRSASMRQSNVENFERWPAWFDAPQWGALLKYSMLVSNR